MAVQDLYLRAADGQMLRLAGKEVAPADWFAEMSRLVALARWAGPQELPSLDALPGHLAGAWREDYAAGQGQRRWLWRGCPPFPELTAALFQALSPVLRAASEPEFRDAASWMISAAYRRWTAPRREVHSPAQPALLPPFTRRAFMTSRHRGNPKVFLGKFLHPEPALSRQGLTAAHIPCYLDHDDVLEQVTPYLAPRRGAVPGGWPQRRFAALCLVMMISDVPAWDEAAETLGLPPLTANRISARYFLIEDLLAFREGLIVAGKRLAGRGFIDYRARRGALAGLAELPAGEWAGRPSVVSRTERYDRGRVFAAAWIWSELTGGRYDESPAWAAHPELDPPVTPTGSGCFYHSWRLKMGPARRDWLRSWGARYLEDRMRGSPAPLCGQPLMAVRPGGGRS